MKYSRIQIGIYLVPFSALRTKNFHDHKWYDLKNQECRISLTYKFLFRVALQRHLQITLGSTYADRLREEFELSIIVISGRTALNEVRD